TLALDVDYIRSDGRNRGKTSDLNERTRPGDDTSRLFYPEQQGHLVIIESIGEDTYDGLQLSIRKRFSNKVQFIVNYTLSKLEGNAETNFADEAECRACVGNDRDIGPYDNDTRNRLVLSGIFQLPGDFQVSALFQGESGRPLTSNSTQDLNGNGRFGTINSALAVGIAEFTPGPNGEPPGRGSFRGDPTYAVDLRVARMFRLGGARELQVSFEAFNLFNRVNRGRNFEQNFESANFGGWTGALTQGAEQFQAQLGVRFSF
ncbi:MAG: hypothetical protein L0191_20295, partial [Acidobacteria bacterium]|nr:hypothetical protein [Acidobacteriota bacterium]